MKTASKYAVLGLTKAMALEFAERGITVNCVCPGFIETAMTANLTEACKLEVAVAAAKSVTTADGNTKTSNLTWFASANAFTDTAAEGSQGGNYYFYAATMSLMNEGFTSAYENLTPVSLQTESLEVTDGAALIIFAVTVILLPVALLVVGIVIWLRRKRR